MLSKLIFLIITLIPVLGFAQDESILQAEYFCKKHLNKFNDKVYETLLTIKKCYDTEKPNYKCKRFFYQFPVKPTTVDACKHYSFTDRLIEQRKCIKLFEEKKYNEFEKHIFETTTVGQWNDRLEKDVKADKTDHFCYVTGGEFRLDKTIYNVVPPGYGNPTNDKTVSVAFKFINGIENQLDFTYILLLNMPKSYKEGEGKDPHKANFSEEDLEGVVIDPAHDDWKRYYSESYPEGK